VAGAAPLMSGFNGGAAGNGNSRATANGKLKWLVPWQRPSRRTASLPSRRTALLRGHHLEPRLKRDIVEVWRRSDYIPIRFSDVSQSVYGSVQASGLVQSQRGLHSYLTEEAIRGTPSVLLVGFLDKSYLVQFRIGLSADGSYGPAWELYPGDQAVDPTEYSVIWPDGNAGEPLLVNTRDRTDIINSERLKDLHAINQAGNIPAASRDTTILRRSYVYETHGYNRKRDVREALCLVSSLGRGTRATLIGWRQDHAPEYFNVRSIFRSSGTPSSNSVEYTRRSVSGQNLDSNPVMVRNVQRDTLPGLAGFDFVYIKIGRFPGDGQESGGWRE